MKTAIDITESKRLVALEQTIARGRQSFVEVADALAEIRDGRLYRADYSTFAEYCSGRWGFSKTYANNLIAGADTIRSLPESMTTTVVNERQARELAKVEPAKREEVVKKAAATASDEGRTITARDIKEAAKPADPEPPQSDEAPHIEVESAGMQFARQAVSLLRRIALTDPQRQQAKALVQDWCDHA